VNSEQKTENSEEKQRETEEQRENEKFMLEQRNKWSPSGGQAACLCFVFVSLFFCLQISPSKAPPKLCQYFFSKWQRALAELALLCHCSASTCPMLWASSSQMVELFCQRTFLFRSSFAKHFQVQELRTKFHATSSLCLCHFYCS